MKILIANMYYYPHLIGGAENSIKLLAEGLVSQGNEVCVVTLDGEPEKAKFDEINGVRIYRIYCKSIYRRRIQNNKGHFFDKISNGLLSYHNNIANKSTDQ